MIYKIADGREVDIVAGNEVRLLKEYQEKFPDLYKVVEALETYMIVSMGGVAACLDLRLEESGDRLDRQRMSVIPDQDELCVASRFAEFFKALRAETDEQRAVEQDEIRRGMDKESVDILDLRVTESAQLHARFIGQP
jgi:hypothetical protein